MCNSTSMLLYFFFFFIFIFFYLRVCRGIIIHLLLFSRTGVYKSCFIIFFYPYRAAKKGFGVFIFFFFFTFCKIEVDCLLNTGDLLFY